VFSGAALVARELEGLRFMMGSTMAVPRARVAEIGGFEALLDQHQNELLGNAEALKRPYSQELSRLPDTEPQKPSTL